MKPLDFRSTPSASGPPTPPPSPSQTGRRRALILISVVVLAVLLAGAFLVSRSGSERADQGVEPADASYCDTAANLVSLLAGAGVPLTGPVPSSVGAEAITVLLAEIGGAIDQFERVAPAEVRAEAKTIVTALKQAGAGDLTRLRAAGFIQAVQSIAEFRLTGACGGSEDGSDAGIVR